jgi:acyl dehydratase
MVLARVKIGGAEELAAKVGSEVAVSDWLEVSQQRIDQFADATGDHQWIHIDVERAKRESPFRAPIAHGFLTLSLLSHFMNNAVEYWPSKMGVNYGLNRMRFTAPVTAGSRLRGRFLLKALERIQGGVQMAWEVSVECEGKSKPALVAEWLTRKYD